MLRHMRDKQATQDSQHSFTKGRSLLTNQMAFYNGVMALVNKGKRNAVICLDLCKAFNVVPHHNHVSKLERDRYEG